MSEKYYKERDIQEQGQHYAKHINAMTAEGLHSKSDIAAELAHRDIIIDQLRAENVKLRRAVNGADEVVNLLRQECDQLRAEAKKQLKKCPMCNGIGRCNDADLGDISFNEWVCENCNGTGEVADD